MRFLVISDLHGDTEHIDMLKEEFSKADAVLCGGDFARFNQEETGLPTLKHLLSCHDTIYAVTGNCDNPDFIEALEDEDNAKDFKPSINVDNFTYQRKDYTIRYGACIDDIITFNYVMYQNDAYSDKWFYAYITDMKWINDKMTEITIKTDVFQTWQFDMEFKTSFIEREHVNNDTIGLHTVPENLETGEYIVEDQSSSQFMNAHVVLGATWDWVNKKTAG